MSQETTWYDRLGAKKEDTPSNDTEKYKRETHGKGDAPRQEQTGERTDGKKRAKKTQGRKPARVGREGRQSNCADEGQTA